MVIVHVSYAHVPSYQDPEKWLSELPFFTVTLEETANYAMVKSIHLINSTSVYKRNGVEYHFLKVPQWQINFPFRINRYVRTLSPDVVMVHGLIFPWQILCLRAQLGTRIRIMVIHHAEKPLRYHKSIFQKLADKFIDGYFFTSYQLAQPWCTAGLIKDISKVHEVMIGSSAFQPIDRTFALQQTKIKGKRTYLWVGSLDTNKDPVTMISAFRSFLKREPENSLYLIFQHDHLLDTVRSLVTDFPQITLVGKVQHPDMTYWYNSVDFLVSTSYYEGGGIAVCEAMSCGCVPILTHIPSFEMMTVGGSVGLLFEAGNVNSLVNTLEKSSRMDLEAERAKVLEIFNRNLSNKAIVKKMIDVVSS